jgi:phage protein D
MARAQAVTDASSDSVLSANGTLDALRYGGLLKPRGLVGLRGAGFTYDGSYYVKSVTHSISRGDYKQRFTITRDGLGSLTPAVIP